MIVIKKCSGKTVEQKESGKKKAEKTENYLGKGREKGAGQQSSRRNTS